MCVVWLSLVGLRCCFILMHTYFIITMVECSPCHSHRLKGIPPKKEGPPIRRRKIYPANNLDLPTSQEIIVGSPRIEPILQEVVEKTLPPCSHLLMTHSTYFFTHLF